MAKGSSDRAWASLGEFNLDRRTCEFLFAVLRRGYSDLADAFKDAEIPYYREEWIHAFVKDVSRNHPEFGPRTKETARWAREQLKRQNGGSLQG